MACRGKKRTLVQIYFSLVGWAKLARIFFEVKHQVFIIYMKLHKLEIIYSFYYLECCEFFTILFPVLTHSSSLSPALQCNHSAHCVQTHTHSNYMQFIMLETLQSIFFLVGNVQAQFLLWFCTSLIEFFFVALRTQKICSLLERM